MAVRDLRGEFDAAVDALRQTDSARKVLLLGQHGAGKTSFLQLLQSLVAIADNRVESERICELHGANPVATQRAVETQIRLGQAVAPLTVIDLPGWQDTDGTQHEGEQDQDHAKHIREAAASAQYLHCVVLVVNGTLARLQPSVDHSLRELAKIYPIDDIRQRVVVLFTFCDSLQRRAFPVAEDTGLLGEIGRQEQLCFYLDNPFGRLAGLDKEDLVSQLADEGDDTAMEIRREVKKGAQTAVKLLKHVSSPALATPARVTAPSSALSFFRSAAVGFPILFNIGILCLSQLPRAQKRDVAYGCGGAALLFAVTFGDLHAGAWWLCAAGAPAAVLGSARSG